MAKIGKSRVAETPFAKTVMATDLSNRSGDVLLESERGLVGVLRHGKPRYVILNIEAYDALRRASDVRRVYKTAEIPQDTLNAMICSMKGHAFSPDK